MTTAGNSVTGDSLSSPGHFAHGPGGTSAVPRKTTGNATGQDRSLDISIPSHGCAMSGSVFPAKRDGPHPALLLIPGLPGTQPDVLGLGAPLREAGVTVFVVHPRGTNESGGTTTFANTLQDIGAALDWLRTREVATRYRLEPSKLTLGGHSYGGGMALAYAARDPDVRRIISVAGTDHAELGRARRRDPAFAASLDATLRSSAAPAGPVRFDIEECYREIDDGEAILGLRENAGRLADRSILLVGGWEDRHVPVEQHLVPFYRALRSAGASDVTFAMYHDDHAFARVRDRMAEDMITWLADRT